MQNESKQFEQASFSEMASAPFCQLNECPFCCPFQLRYADNWDWLLLTIGVLTSIIGGALGPASSLIFRGITAVLMEGQHRLENGTLDIEYFSEGSWFGKWHEHYSFLPLCSDLPRVALLLAGHCHLHFHQTQRMPCQ